MCVVEIDEVGSERPRHRAVRLERAGRVDADAEILADRVAAKRQRAARERTGELDRIAVRPVDVPVTACFFCAKLELQPEMLDRERPGP